MLTCGVGHARGAGRVEVRRGLKGSMMKGLARRDWGWERRFLLWSDIFRDRFFSGRVAVAQDLFLGVFGIFGVGVGSGGGGGGGIGIGAVAGTLMFILFACTADRTLTCWGVRMK